MRTSLTFDNFVSAWLLLPVYLLVDVLYFVIVLFQSGVFEYILVYVDVLDSVIVLFQSGVFGHILVHSGWGGAVVHICKMYLCTPRKLLQGAKIEVVRDVWEFQRSPSRLLSSMIKCIFIPDDIHAVTSLDNYGL